MASDNKDVVKQAEQFTPAQEESSKSLSGLADQYFRELFSKAKIGGADDDASKRGGDQQARTLKTEQQKPVGAEANTVASGLQKLFDKAKNPTVGANQTEDFANGKGELRTLVTADGGVTGQYVDAAGKTTTRISENASVEYDPQTKQYTGVDNTGKRATLQDNDKVDPSDKNSKTLKELKESGVSSDLLDGGKSNSKTTFLDGRVTTEYSPPSQLTERTTFPPGYAGEHGENAGVREQEKFRPLSEQEKSALKGLSPDDLAVRSSGRTVNTFDDRKESNFTSEDSKISKITAFKDPDHDQPAVRTDYRNNKGPDAASSVDTYRSNGRPEGVKEVAQFHDANGKETRSDKMTFNNGAVLDRPANGDIREPIGSGDKAGVLDIDKNSGMPSHMKVGDNDYKVAYSPDGKVNSMTVEAAGPPPSKLSLERNPNTNELQVKASEGKFQPDANGKINLEGLPINIKDGKVDGDVHLNKEGDLRYVSSGGAERHEIVRRANGNLEDYDFKNWTKTTTAADGKVQDPVERWDGYKWRSDGKPSTDGKHVDFPDGTFTERKTGGDPPQDVTVFGAKDHPPQSYDWKNGVMTSVDKSGQEVKAYYDGVNYRPGTEQKLPNGDTSIQFAPPLPGDQPATSLRHQDGSLTNVYADQSKVERDARGQLTEVDNAAGSTKFERDGDGDINKVSEFGADGKLKVSYSRSGQEQDPGMEQWLGRAGNEAPRQPTDTAPRDPSKPTEYNSWKTTTAINDNTSVEYDPASKSYTRIDKDGTRAALSDDKAKLDPHDPKSKTLGEFKAASAAGPNAEAMNIHTTADGVVRIESAARPELGKQAELQVKTPVGGSYRDTPSERITEKPGGITETLDKTQNPPISKLRFNRNGKPVELSSANGPYSVADDGTVEQKATDGKSSTCYFADGSVAKMAIDGDKQTVAELDLAHNPAKQNEGMVLKPGTAPCKSLQRVGNSFVAQMTDAGGRDIPTVFDPASNTKKEQLPNEQFATVSDLTTGATVGLSTLDGDPLLKYSADGKSAVLADGHSYSADKWDINPSQLKVGANGEAIISGVDPKDQAIIKPSGASFDMVGGKVVSYKLPGSDSVDVAKMQATNPKAEAKYNATDGSLSINDGDKQSFVVYKDGSLDQTVKGANGAPDLQVHRDSHLNLLPTDAQAKELGQLADAAIKDTAQQPKFAQELMKRIQTRQDLSTFFEALNNGVLKQMGASVALQTGDDKKLNIILTKDGKPIAIPFS